MQDELTHTASGSGRSDIVGADRDAERIARTLNEAGTVLLIGAPGAGKSHLLGHIDSRIRQAGGTPIRISGARALQNVRLGAVHRSNDPRAWELFADGERRDAPLRPRPRPIVLVDDAEYLDAATLDALLRMLYLDSACALLALNTRDDHLAGAEIAETRHLIIELWSSGMASRVDLGDLVHADSDRLISLFTQGARIDTVTRAALHEWSGGSRLILKELCLLATARMARGADPFDADETDAPVIADLIRRRLVDLPDDAGLALALAYRVTGLSYARAARIIRPATLTALVSARLVLESGHPVRRLYVSPVVGAIANALVDAGTLEGVVNTILLRADGDDGALAPPGPGIGTELAYRWLRGESEPSSRRYRGEVFVAAARTAAARGEHDLTALFAREAMRDDRTGDAVGLVAVSLLSTGQLDAATTLIEEWILAGDGPGENAIALWTAVALALPDRGSLDWVAERVRASGHLSASDATILECGRGLGQLFALDLSAATTTAQALLRSPDAPTNVRIAAALTAAMAASLGADHLALAEYLAEAERLNRDPATGRIRSRQGAAVILGAETLCRVVAGFGVDVVEPKVARLIGEAVVTDDRLSLGMLSWISGIRAAFHGDLEEALTDIGAALVRVGEIVPGVAIVLRAHQAAILLELERQDEARELLDALPKQTAWPLFDRMLDHVWTQAGDPAAARPDTGATIVDAHTAYREGLAQPDAHAVRLTRLSEGSDSALLAAMAAHVRALAVGDAEAAARAAVAFDEVHAFGWAARAYTNAAEIAAAQGNRRYATELSSRAKAAIALSGGTQGADGPDAAATLTPREREIARLAADGASNKEIASALFLSVRTVESHLYQVRMKLGAASRRELATLLHDEASRAS